MENTLDITSIFLKLYQILPKATQTWRAIDV